MRSILCVLLIGLSIGPLDAVAQSLLGSSVTVLGRFPDVGTLPATAIVGPDIEFTELRVVPGDYSLPVRFDVGANSVDLGFGYSFASFSPAFYGFVFTFSSLPVYITGVAAHPGSSPEISQVTFEWSSNQMTFDFSQVDIFTPEAHFGFDVFTSPVPEPGSSLLASLGVLTLVYARFLGSRRRHRAALIHHR